jgi:hypothetical protein
MFNRGGKCLAYRGVNYHLTKKSVRCGKAQYIKIALAKTPVF